MRKLIGTVFVFGFGMVAMWTTMNFHLVKTDSYWFVVRKQEVRIADCFVDIEEWDDTEWDKHPELKESLVKAGRSEFIPRKPAEAPILDVLRRLGNAVQESSTQRQ